MSDMWFRALVTCILNAAELPSFMAGITLSQDKVTGPYFLETQSGRIGMFLQYFQLVPDGVVLGFCLFRDLSSLANSLVEQGNSTVLGLSHPMRCSLTSSWLICWSRSSTVISN